MATQEFEADRLLKRLKQSGRTELSEDRIQQNAGPIFQAIQELYTSLGIPHPGFTLSFIAREAVLKRQRAGLDRFKAQGAPRNPHRTFQALYDATLGNSTFGASWRNHMGRLEQRCGNEPADFVRRIDEAGERACLAARKTLNSETHVRRQEAIFRSAAAVAVEEAAGLFSPSERKEAIQELAGGVRNSALLPHLILEHEIGEWARWRARHGAKGKPEHDRVTPLLKLIELLELGVWFFWGAADQIVVVARPPLRPR